MIKYPPQQFWKVFKETPGAFSTAEAIALYNICLCAPSGLYAEFGSYHGKSSMAALLGLKDGIVFLVDPIFENNPIVNKMGVYVVQFADSVFELRFISDYSTNVISKIVDEVNPSGYSYVFVDSGSHQDGLPMREVRLLEDRMAQGGIIAFHDYKNQFTEVEQAYDYLVSTGKYEPIHIDWQPIFAYVKEHNLEEGNNSWHIYDELPHPPNFIGALRRK